MRVCARSWVKTGSLPANCILAIALIDKISCSVVKPNNLILSYLITHSMDHERTQRINARARAEGGRRG